MTVVIRSLMMTMHMRSQSGLRSVLRHAIHVVVNDHRLREYLTSGLEEQPSIRRSTLYRHRLTLHLGYCKMFQEVHETMLRASGGAVRWGTVDSSPQGGVDYLMWGCATMRQSDLIPAMALAEELASRMDDEEEERRVVQLLAALVKLTKSVPTAIGSGRAAMKYKVHAYTHATRLTSNSWRSAASLVNCGVTLTGDLGTESRFPEFRGFLSAMLGDWGR